MTEERYIFNASRVITLWLLPTFFTFLTLFLIYSKFDSIREFTLKDFIAWTFFFIFSVGIFIYLFLNHLPYARQTQLIIINKTFKIIQSDNSYSANFSDIEEIVNYSANRLPWGYIMKWKIRTADTEVIISSLTISQFNFERHFYNKIKDKTCFLPTI